MYIRGQNLFFTIVLFICFGFKKTNREISTTSHKLNKTYLSTDEVFDRNLVCKTNFLKNKFIVLFSYKWKFNSDYGYNFCMKRY